MRECEAASEPLAVRQHDDSELRDFCDAPEGRYACLRAHFISGRRVDLVEIGIMSSDQSKIMRPIMWMKRALQKCIKKTSYWARYSFLFAWLVIPTMFGIYGISLSKRAYRFLDHHELSEEFTREGMLSVHGKRERHLSLTGAEGRLPISCGYYSLASLCVPHDRIDLTKPVIATLFWYDKENIRIPIIVELKSKNGYIILSREKQEGHLAYFAESARGDTNVSSFIRTFIYGLFPAFLISTFYTLPNRYMRWKRRKL